MFTSVSFNIAVNLNKPPEQEFHTTIISFCVKAHDKIRKLRPRVLEQPFNRKINYKVELSQIHGIS